MVRKSFMFFILSVLFTVSAVTSQTISGDLKLWHKVAITFGGPRASETGSPNPFLDYRMDVTFTNGSETFTVPGFFAADGDAANTSAESGDKWRVNFTPNITGEWGYEVSFREGSNVAIDDNALAGSAGSLDGTSGTFAVVETDKQRPDFRARGMLRYVNKHYLQFEGDETYFLKGGAGSPENFLAYADFDGTRDDGGIHFPALEPDQLHKYPNHVADWNSGDPVWKTDKGKGIIGALNYISEKGINAAYILLMNTEGDGRDLWPWVDSKDLLHFDVSKLAQWEIVFTHMDKVGMMRDFMLSETENESLFEHLAGGGTFADSRKLYYREMTARFSHHPAVTWNLGEEMGHTSHAPFGNATSSTQQKAFAQFIKDLDPYDHHIVLHNYPNTMNSLFTPLLGFDAYDGLSMQESQQYNARVKEWVDKSADAGHPWIVAIDEPLGWEFGCRPDGQDPSHDDARKHVLWGGIMAGGAGVDWYFGWQNNAPTSDLSNEDWRSRQNMWIQTKHALDLFDVYVPFEQMTADNGLTSEGSDYVFYLENDMYLIYLPNGGTTNLNLGGANGDFVVKWYDPRNGGPLQDGNVTRVTAGGQVSVGNAPDSTNRDWAVIVSASLEIPLDETAPSTPQNLSCVGSTNTTITIDWDASTDEGSGVRGYNVQIDAAADVSIAGTSAVISGLSRNTSYDITVTALDRAGNESEPSATLTQSTADLDGPPNTLFLRAGSGEMNNGMQMTTESGSLTPSPIYGTSGTIAAPGADDSRVEYTVNLPVSGNWYAWIRTTYPSDGENSMWVQVDGASEVRIANGTELNAWHWEGDAGSTPLLIGNISAGEHTLLLTTREPSASFLIDVVCLTANPDYVPSDDDVWFGDTTGPADGVAPSTSSSARFPVARVGLRTYRLALAAGEICQVSITRPNGSVMQTLRSVEDSFVTWTAPSPGVYLLRFLRGGALGQSEVCRRLVVCR